ncbi:hypothetical protein KKA00_00230 [bacterium]|nr:hypothetical protein [bacterium]MBU1650617.1 hypothetical protein [bacterium]MBU1881100.1 hypothetical protein [bacterium]
MKKVGYLEGTDSTYLTRLALHGVDTLPLGNGADNHGKYIGFVDRADAIDLVITYYHKIVPLAEQRTSPQSLLQACQLNNIPVLIITPGEHHEKAQAAFKDVSAEYKLVDPENVMIEAKKILGL